MKIIMICKYLSVTDSHLCAVIFFVANMMMNCTRLNIVKNSISLKIMGRSSNLSLFLFRFLHVPEPSLYLSFLMNDDNFPLNFWLFVTSFVMSLYPLCDNMLQGRYYVGNIIIHTVHIYKSKECLDLNGLLVAGYMQLFLPSLFLPIPAVLN